MMKTKMKKPMTKIERELEEDPHLKTNPKRKRLLKRWLNAAPEALLSKVERGLTKRCSCDVDPDGIEGCPRHLMDEAVLLNLMQRYDKDLEEFWSGTLEQATRFEILQCLHGFLGQMSETERTLVRLMHWMSTGINIHVPDILFAEMRPLYERFDVSAHNDGGWEYAIHCIMAHYEELNPEEAASLLRFALPYDNGDEEDGPGSLSNTIEWFKERIEEKSQGGAQ